MYIIIQFAAFVNPQKKIANITFTDRFLSVGTYLSSVGFIIVRSNTPEGKKKRVPLALSFGGGKGIRTLVRLLSNGFQDRLVMTTSISLRKGIQFQSLEKILEKTLERMMRRRRKILKVKEIQGFFEVCFRYDKKFSRPPRYDRFDTSPYMNLSFDRNHLIFNCFRNSFRNALLCCLRSA